uniref:Cleavage and polyadenylation specificity factor subunit 4 n=1 Tax=Aplanochytrium stocchinoi TaxID=215587 RepID=A0A7S3PP37_9STRA|mmetsp:Transcript_992/g.1255  ORF Transcript_992/g.1255 Transcript_992/m.1255 type:complete len:213 (-) Transcript_992:865-1503(-)
MGKVDKNVSVRDHTNGNKIIIVGFSADTDEQKLKAMCERFGTVLSATVVRDVDTKKSKGFGFVRFDSVEAQVDAIAGLDQTKTHNNRTLNVRAVENISPSKNKSSQNAGNNSQDGSSKPSGFRRPCAKFLKGKCDKGESCQYAHVRIPEGYCFKYQQGKCHRGRACKWKHELITETSISNDSSSFSNHSKKRKSETAPSKERKWKRNTKTSK